MCLIVFAWRPDHAQPLVLAANRDEFYDRPTQFLTSALSPEAFFHELAQRADDYAGFNLLAGNRDELWFYHSWEGTPQRLPAGLYGFSNAQLDTPWPKVQRAKAALAACLQAPHAEPLLTLMSDPQQADAASLPDTGVGLNTEVLLSSVFIASRSYGTRASTALIVQADGARQIVERSYGPHGEPLGDIGVKEQALRLTESV